MANELKDQDYLIALNFVTGCAIIDPDDCTLTTKTISPEKMVIKREGYQQLSHEAKEIINIILYGPNEIIDILSTPIKKTITIRRVRRFFEFYFSSNFITDCAIEEIKTWVNQL